MPQHKTPIKPAPGKKSPPAPAKGSQPKVSKGEPKKFGPEPKEGKEARFDKER